MNQSSLASIIIHIFDACPNPKTWKCEPKSSIAWQSHFVCIKNSSWLYEKLDLVQQDISLNEKTMKIVENKCSMHYAEVILGCEQPEQWHSI